jgi:hypothetical protein
LIGSGVLTELMAIDLLASIKYSLYKSSSKTFKLPRREVVHLRSEFNPLIKTMRA